MSWMQKLYETYEQCAGVPEFIDSENPLLPMWHITRNAHIEVIIDQNSNFLRAKVLPKEEQATIIPCTEASATRTGKKPVNHPLCDKLQYVAGDYLNYGGVVTSGFKKNPGEPHQNYLSQLSNWIASSCSHQKVEAIYPYVMKGRLITDLIRERCLFVDEANKLIKEWEGDKETRPDVFKIMPAGQPPENALVRWRVEVAGEPLSATWEDRSLMEAWIKFDPGKGATKGLCHVTGRETAVAKSHPKGIRRSGDSAKLISSDDKRGFTFRGRFTDKDGMQACTISAEVTQKVHNALRWLIGRQSYYNDGQVIVAWAVSGVEVPDPFADTGTLFGIKSDTNSDSRDFQGDAGQSFALRLARLIAGYQAKLGSTEDIVVMCLDSATPGRMAITYYRELTGSEFLERIKAWHETFVWHQHYSKAVQFVGAPSPKDIAESAYGSRVDDKLRKATVERLLPCIMDGQQLPRDLVISSFRRACNRSGLELWEWNKVLGIACALYKGFYRERNYQMVLEKDRTSRDYLYGRLLALADHLEDRALFVAGESRDTTAAKLMQRFADRPCSTWRNIELSLSPYKARLHSKRPTTLKTLDILLDEVICSFVGSDFTDNRPLTGEFLLGYHCQRRDLRPKSATEKEVNKKDAMDD